MVLSIGLKLGELIERRMPGVKVIYTRKDDTFVELRQRTQIANENQAKLFISIHANANKSSSPAGFETYLLGATKGAQASAVAERENAVIRFESSENQAHYKGINAILAGLAQTAFMKQSEHLPATCKRKSANACNR
ncbi:MAG: N-acetylmuramoyl-L-alanine amidase [Calditrichia bacterium]